MSRIYFREASWSNYLVFLVSRSDRQGFVSSVLVKVWFMVYAIEVYSRLFETRGRTNNFLRERKNKLQSLPRVN